MKKFDSVKYTLLRAVDVSGFKVLDPVVRLAFGEEPSKQLRDIFRFLVVPTTFVLVCLGTWTVIAPRHKTKSGEVPTPEQVWKSLVINDTLNRREDEKESDFQASDADRAATIDQVKELLAARETNAAELKSQLSEIEAATTATQNARVGPLQEEYDKLKSESRERKSQRKLKIEELAEKVANENATSGELLEALREDKRLSEESKVAEKAVKEQINKTLSEPPVELKAAQMAFNKAANEVQHLKKRLDYLETGNRSLKVAKAEELAVASLAKLDSAGDAAAILASAKSVVRNEEKAAKTAAQNYPRAATIWFQVQRSLFTVFVGFVLAAAIAIPVGIMCGLNRVVMACLTPIISIFKPVSPVVWLLIFQIVVGAFFPNPETHPLFVYCSKLPFIGKLGVNPALIFSACTVAMCALWPALVNTALGVSSVERDHINVARVLRLGLWDRLTKIIIPSALPLVFAGLRISLGVGWMVLIAAEALSSSEGLGKFVWDEYQNGSSHSFANIIFACFVVGIIGFFLDRVMIVLQRLVSFDDGAAAV